MNDLTQSIGYQYLQQTKIDRNTFFTKPRPKIEPCSTFKTIPDAKSIILPRTWPKNGDSIWNLLQRRRSTREFSDRAITLTELAALLWAAQGITAQAGHFFLRTAPSAGALYPIETYVSITNGHDIERGLYHFNNSDFTLEQLQDAKISIDIGKASMDQNFIEQGSATFIWTAVYRRTMSKYGHRAGRYICMDAAHVCHNLLLAAESLGFSSCPIGAFYDEELNTQLGVDGNEESSIYLAVIG